MEVNRENVLQGYRANSSQEYQENSTLEYQENSTLEYQENTQRGYWENPEAGNLIIKEEIKEEDDIEICEIRVVNQSQPKYGKATLLQNRPTPLLKYAFTNPVTQCVAHNGSTIPPRIKSIQSMEQPRSIPIILPQHTHYQVESKHRITSPANLSPSHSSIYKPKSASYPQQRQGTPSAFYDAAEQTLRKDPHGSPITSKHQISSKPLMPPMPNLIPIPLIEEAILPIAEPTVRIVEHPKENSLRFRYECEGRSAGSLQGVNSTAANKTFPSIEILNYRGPAVVVVSCVNATGSPLTHPHNLVGKDCKKGVCTLNINNDSMFCMFPNLGIQCVRRKDVEKSLTHRQSIRVDPFKKGFHHKNAPNKIDLNAVRLCFQVFVVGERGTFTKKLDPVLSNPIYDAKARKDLQILELSDDHSSVDGGRKIIILCEKVAKEDVQVNFFEEDEEGNRTWEALGDFRQSDVHKQYGICLKSPRYKDKTIASKVRVSIELRKSSNRTETSDSLPFYYTPTPHVITSSTPSPSPPYLQHQFSMFEVSNSISEEDLPTILINSHVTTASEDDVTRAVYNMDSKARRQPVQGKTSKRKGPDSTSMWGKDRISSVSPPKIVKLK